MFPLAELYPVISEHYGDIPEVQQGMIRIAWNYCVGERLKDVSEPLNFHDGVLRVRVPHSQWQMTLNDMKPRIISKINRYLKKPLLNDVTIEVP